MIFWRIIEDGSGTVLRLYESENARTQTVLRVPAGVAKAYSCNLLEEIEEELPVRSKMTEAAEREDLFSSFMNMVSFQFMLHEIAAAPLRE